MSAVRQLVSIVVGLIVMRAAICAAAPLEPPVLPTVGDTFAAPYDAVWEAALKSVGAVRTVAANKAQGHIETEPYIFRFGFGSEASQTLLVSLAITLRRIDDRRTEVQVQTRIHDAWLTGMTPGPFSNPWTDYLVRLRENLRLHS